MASSHAAEQATASAAPLTAQEIEDLQDDIAMQRILLDSLEGTSSDTPARRNELQQVMRDLQRKLNLAVRGQAAHRGTCSHMPAATPWHDRALTAIVMKPDTNRLGIPRALTDKLD